MLTRECDLFLRLRERKTNNVYISLITRVRLRNANGKWRLVRLLWGYYNYLFSHRMNTKFKHFLRSVLLMNVVTNHDEINEWVVIVGRTHYEWLRSRNDLYLRIFIQIIIMHIIWISELIQVSFRNTKLKTFVCAISNCIGFF